MGEGDKHKTPLCKISMFLAGFIFFTPHRIAITCANHVVKRYHLPLGTVAMFVYRLHNLMELGSFAGTVVNTVITLSSNKMGDEKKKTLKNCVSGISIWLMFIWSIITYISFMAGGEYGYFGEFFWNIVILVFIYGVYSNSAMGIEGLNGPLYIVGLPLFGLFTFVFHKLYKYLYYIYFWDEYDYVLVLYQIWIMIILSFATSIVWTVARVKDSETGETTPTTITLEIHHTPSENQTKTYTSGGSTMKVKYQDASFSAGSATFQFYIHSLPNGGKFTLNATITHDTGKTGTLDEGPVNDVYEVYYYKSANKGALKIKAVDGDKIFYNTNTAASSGSTWAKEPVPATETDLLNLVNKIKDEVEIKVDKIKPYGCKKRINVERKDGDGQNNNPVPNNYIRYKHSPKDTSKIPFKLGPIRYKDIPLKFDQAFTTEDVQAVFVYYEKDNDPNHEFPLIVCVDTGNSQTRKYYKRGNRWTEISSSEISRGPEDNQVAGELSGQFTQIIDKYEIKLEKTNDDGQYKATPDGQSITPRAVEEKGTPQYKGFKHTITDTTKEINRVTIWNHVITQISQTDFANKLYVFVYFTKAQADGTRQKPLLICLSKDHTKDNTKGDSNNNIWYKRKYDTATKVYSWEKDQETFRSIKPGGESGNQIDTQLAQKLQKIKQAVTNDPGYPKLEPNLSDTMKSKPDSGLAKLFGMGEYKEYHILHWSPIFLVALSLGTVYFFYPAISPYQLVDDPFDGKKIELWIQAISATPHIAFAITQLCEVGPGRLWTNNDQEDDNYKWYKLYHATWLFFIPYIICIYFFFSMMHFPEGRIGKYFRASVFRTGVLCVVFAWVQEFMEAVGFGGGMGAQVSGRCGDTFNDDAGTIFGFMFPVFMVIFMFTEELY